MCIRDSLRTVYGYRLVYAEYLHFGCGRFTLFLAGGAESLDKALCDNADNRVCDKIILHAHVFKTGNGARSVVGMQCTEHKVSRNCRTDSYLCSLFITDLSYHCLLYTSTDRSAAVRAFAVYNLRFGKECLAGCTVCLLYTSKHLISWPDLKKRGAVITKTDMKELEGKPYLLLVTHLSICLLYTSRCV